MLWLSNDIIITSQKTKYFLNLDFGHNQLKNTQFGQITKLQVTNIENLLLNNLF